MTRSLLDFQHILAAVVYAGLGLIVYCVAFEVFDKVTPYKLWEEIIQKQNRALAQVVAGLSIGMAIIVAAAIVG
jgi:putative membrane protein